MSVEQVVFACAALVAISGAFGVVFSRNPVHSALSLVATLFAIAVLFLNQNANLLAVVQILVYTGAIVILILFVMMLLGVDRDEDIETEPIVGQRALAALAAFALAGAVLAVVVMAQVVGDNSVATGARSSLQELVDGEAASDIRQIGDLIFTNYVFALMVTAALLTIAVVGAVVMSRRVRTVQALPEPESMDDAAEPLVPSREQAE
jgi:NADH-quinone oxidoreductase subunit J